MKHPIDFVILWVDSGDPVWAGKKKEYMRQHSRRDSGNSGTNMPYGTLDDRGTRYEDRGTLKYLFRGIAAFAPWVRKIFLVTDHQCPKWLDTSSDKVELVFHEDFMDPDCLPSFNSDAIEVNLHRIRGLSERFVYFNDDMFLLRPVRPEDFFIGRKPVDMLALQPVIANPKNPVMSKIFMNNALAVSRHFQKRDTMKRMPLSYCHIGYPLMYFGYNALEALFPQYTGFYTIHNPSPLLKSTLAEVWKEEGEVLKKTSRSHIRSEDDVNQYLFREWQKQTGKFVPKNILRDFGYFELSDDNTKLGNTIVRQKKKMICVNDPDRADFDAAKIRRELAEYFSAVFPEKCEFEK